MTCSAPTPPRPNRNTHVMQHLEEVMGTVVTIDAYGDAAVSPSEVAPLIAHACALLHEADDMFSMWKPHSPTSRLRRGEITKAMAPPEVAAVLELCATARQLSGGWFDPWALPGGVDPTGYVKGWAAQRALGALAAPFITGAIVNAAGDIASFGGLCETQGFRFGIVNPLVRGELLCVVEGTSALATSGSYERGLHLIDPHTGSAVAPVASATVSGPDLGLADALATAVAVAGHKGLGIVGALEGYDAMIVALDGTMRWTAEFPIAST